MSDLSPAQLAMLSEILRKWRPDLLDVAMTSSGGGPDRGTCVEIQMALGRELVDSGMDAQSGLNQRGFEIESLIDVFGEKA